MRHLMFDNIKWKRVCVCVSCLRMFAIPGQARSTFQDSALRGTAGGSVPGANAEMPAASLTSVEARAAASGRLRNRRLGMG